MLLSLTIRDVVLIDKLTVGFSPGLCALTGETGAGKSILLDSLGLALGNRADSNLVRKGAEQASVTAAFELPAHHPAESVLAEHGLAPDEDNLVLRRVVRANGRGRAYVNDQPVSAGLLRQLADHLVEIQGQFAQRGLMDPNTHRDLLDGFGGLLDQRQTVAQRYAEWREAIAARAAAERELDQARRDEDFLRHALSELDELAPQPGEEAHLAEQRNRLMNAEKLVTAFNTAEAELTGGESGRGAQEALAGARRALERTADVAGADVQHALDALDRAMAESEDALARLHSLSSEIELDSGQQQEIEERYFALKDLARKHGVEVDALPDLRERFAQRLAAIDSGSERITDRTGALRDAVQAA